MKVLIEKRLKLSESEISQLQNLGYEVSEYVGEKVVADVFVGMLRPPYTELNNIEGLKYIQSTIAGYDTLDMDKIKAMGITFANASGIGSDPIAEYVTYCLLDHFHNFSKYRQYQNENIWGSRSEADLSIEELVSKRVLVLGTGSIGKAIAKRLNAFSVDLIGVNSNGRAVEGFSEVYALSDVVDVLNSVDVVIGALPLNMATNKMYNEQFFKNMKKNSIFLNVGRGPQLVTDDLLVALDDNISAAYLDVFEQEPLASDSLLWNHPKVVITPHISSSSTMVKNRVKRLVLDNLENYKLNKPLLNKVI